MNCGQWMQKFIKWNEQNDVQMVYQQHRKIKSKSQRVRNEDIPQSADAHNTVLKSIERRWLKWSTYDENELI